MSVSSLPLALLDTNILGYLYRKDPLGDLYAAKIEGFGSLMAFQTLAEIRFGMERANWGKARRADQEQFLARFRVIFPTPQTCTLWAAVRAAARRSGKQTDTADAWIAATALALKCPLVTHNAADFSGIAGLNLITENLQL